MRRIFGEQFHIFVISLSTSMLVLGALFLYFSALDVSARKRPWFSLKRKTGWERRKRTFRVFNRRGEFFSVLACRQLTRGYTERQAGSLACNALRQTQIYRFHGLYGRAYICVKPFLELSRRRFCSRCNCCRIVAP